MRKTYRGAVIFDGDGATIDSEGVHKRVANEAVKKFGISNIELFRKNIRQAFLEAGLGEQEFRSFIKLFRERENLANIRVFPYVNEVLLELRLRGYLTGFFTNRSMDAHNCRTILESGLDYDLVDFLMFYNAPDTEPPAVQSSKYLRSPFRKPIGMSSLPFVELIQDVSDAPQSIYYVGDNVVDLEFARRNNFSFVGVLSGVIKTRAEWLRHGAETIVPDVRSLLYLLPLPGRF